MRLSAFVTALLVSHQALAQGLTLAATTASEGAREARDPGRQAPLAHAAKLALLRAKIRYVFVLFQENRSFDHYFGTYPGANGLFATYPGANLADPEQRPAKDNPNFHQIIWTLDGSFGTQTPFLSPRSVLAKTGAQVTLYPEDMSSVDHSREGMLNSMHFDHATKTRAQNDGFAATMQKLSFSTDATTPATLVDKTGRPPQGKPSLLRHQAGELILAHVDCDTIPFLWQLADRFTLFDNFHQTTIAPSTPNAIAMIAGQTGETQWALHPQTTSRLIPVINDDGPFPGSPQDTAPVKPPYGPDEQEFAATGAPPALAPIAGATLKSVKLLGTPGLYNVKNKALPPLTSASLPLSFMGRTIEAVTSQDEHKGVDLADIARDIPFIAAHDSTVPWGWYQQGFGPEPFDGNATVDLAPAGTAHPSYIVHHNGPQYFGYLGDNPAELARMHSLAQFRRDVENGNLPDQGGVFYVRGGFYNNDDMQTLNPNPDVRAIFAGNDDHPGYADSQISEALIADSVNAIAASRYWPHSAIIITYDETDGLYDHVPERVRSWGPDGQPLTGGPRIPAIVISAYGAAHTVSHVYSEHSSVIKFIDALFRLTPLADLPDEKRARGASDPALRAPDGTVQKNLGPADDFVDMGDLLEAFDNDRLLGRAPLLPAMLAHIDGVTALPHLQGQGCARLKITPTDYPNGLKSGGEIDPPPADFNPRPKISPGIPTDGTWVP